MSQPQKCEACGRRRNLRGWRLCDECALDWWYANGGDSWERQLLEDGWALVPDWEDVPPADERVAVLAERRWGGPDVDLRTTSLWDTPLTERQRRRAAALTRREAHERLTQRRSTAC